MKAMIVDSRFGLISGALVLLAVLFVVMHGLFDASFWLDELYSVTIAQADFDQLFAFAIKDVHPPLYYIALSGWLIVFQDNELQTRLFSAVFSLLSLLFIYGYLIKLMNRSAFFVYLLLFITNPAFYFYAMEARSYAFGLFFAFVVTLNFCFYDGKWRTFLIIIAAGMALSLTHYFGVLLTVLIYTALLVQHARDPWRVGLVVAAGLVAVAWPLLQFATGSVGTATAAGNWVSLRVSNSLDTVKGAFCAASPAICYATPFLPKALLAAISLGALALVAGALLWTGQVVELVRRAWRPLGLVVAYVACVVVVDLIQPVSTARNFMLLLPAMYLVAALAASLLLTSTAWIRRGTAITLGVFLVGQSIFTGVRLLDKALSFENFLQVAQIVKQKKDAKETLYYFSSQYIPEWSDLVHNYYLKRDDPDDFEAVPFSEGEIMQADAPFLLAYCHLGIEFDEDAFADLLQRIEQKFDLEVTYAENGLRRTRTCGVVKGTPTSSRTG